MTDNQLIQKTSELVNQERALLTVVLKHLKEIERRRLYCDYGYKSLHDMCVKYFKYSDDQAYRRVAAARLLDEMPMLEEKIENGELNLTNMSLAQSLFKQEPQLEKIKVIKQICGKSTREAERITASMTDKPLKQDRINFVSEDQIELRFTASPELQRKIEILKGRYAHKHPRLGLGELFELLCDQALQTAAPRKLRITKDKCSNCGSTHALEIDHIRARAKGGTNQKENLRVLCRPCNQRHAIKTYGQQKIDKYIN